MIRINEIFKSISGEAGHPHFPQGTFCTFVRFQGCPLSCSYCDTKHSQNSVDGESMTVEDIIQKIGPAKNILITGGEPQMQQFGLSVLVRNLVHLGKLIQIETNGAYIPPAFGASVTWVMDYKLPSSGMMPKMLSMFSFFETLKKGQTVIKFVFGTQEDVDTMLWKISIFIEMLELHNVDLGFAPFIVSPTETGRQFSQQVVEKIFEHNFQEYCLLSLQSHKVLDLK